MVRAVRNGILELRPFFCGVLRWQQAAWHTPASIRLQGVHFYRVALIEFRGMYGERQEEQDKRGSGGRNKKG